MTRAWDPDRYLPDPGDDSRGCPCPEGCSPLDDCGWLCVGDKCHVCHAAASDDDETETETDEDEE